MKHRLTVSSLPLLALFLALAPTAMASTTWYVNGVNGSNTNNCKSLTTACKTIGHAISLASSGDTIRVAPGIYMAHLTISIGLSVIGSGAQATIVDGGGNGTVVTIPNTSTSVILSSMTIRHGNAPRSGGGIYSNGTLTVNNSAVSQNATYVCVAGHCFGGSGGGIFNNGTLTVNRSTISGNVAGSGGGILSNGTLTINNSTVSQNAANGFCIYIFHRLACGGGSGGGIAGSTVTITNSTIAGNSANGGNGGGINGDIIRINNSTVSQNVAKERCGYGWCLSGSGGGIWGAKSTTLQNSIVANSPNGGNCIGTMTSLGYNLSSDNTCNFNNTGDLNNTDPMFGPLQNNGGPTQTMALASESPAIDAGNPSGCTDGLGHLLKTDQRGKPRPDSEDKNGCDMGAYERQSD